MIRVDLSGVTEPDRLLGQVRDAASAGLEDAAGIVLDRSNSYVPYERGSLLRSGKVTADEGDLHAAVSYTGQHAVDQHEDLSLEHDSGRRGKYLETAGNESTADVAAAVADRVRRAVR